MGVDLEQLKKDVRTLRQVLGLAKKLAKKLPITEEWKQSILEPLNKATMAVNNIDGCPSSMLQEERELKNEN